MEIGCGICVRQKKLRPPVRNSFLEFRSHLYCNFTVKQFIVVVAQTEVNESLRDELPCLVANGKELT